MCGAVAIHVEMTAPGDPLISRGSPSDSTPVPTGSPGVRTEAGTLDFWLALETETVRARVEAAIEAADVPELLRIDDEIVPLFCRECDASYCEEHWSTWLVFDPELPGWLDEMRGRCPASHERRVHD